MELKNTNSILEKYKNYVVQQARSNLSRNKKNVSKTLYSSIKGEVVKENNYAIVGFEMESYGQFVDEGVKGAFPGLVTNGVQKAPNSRFQFTNKRPPADIIGKWAKKRNIRLRDESGKFVKGNYKTIGFVLAERIYAQGMKPTLFFTKPFEDGFKKYIDNQLENGVVLDVDVMVDFTLKNIK